MEAPAPSSGQAVTYSPPPNEMAYYEGLFTAADQAKTGQLNGREAVAFLARSKLPMDLLKNIWTMSDQNPKTNYLDKKKFFVAVRLIQIFQNGQSPKDPTLAAPEGIVMRPPYFEGITDAAPSSAPAPPAQAEAEPTQQPPLQQPAAGFNAPVENNPPPTQQPMNAGGQNVQTALTAQDPYNMVPGEQVRYEQLFPKYAKEGFVYGQEAVALFSKSGVDKLILRDIWNMVDDPVDNRLSKLEFAIAMHMIVCVSKKNLPMPPTLPASLKRLKDADNKESVAPTGVPNEQADPAIQQPENTPNQTVIPTPKAEMTGQDQAVTMQPNNGMAITDAFSDIAPPEITPPTPAQVTNSPDQPSYVPQLNTYNQQQQQQLQYEKPPPSPSSGIVETNPAPPAEIAIDPNEKHTPSIISAIQPSPTLHARPNLSEPPKLAIPTSSGNSDKSELDQVRTVLQKLQAENVSLKAQLGQFSEEEMQVRQEITSTVAEIGVLSQELTTLRGKVVEAKAGLIEATSELKAQIEKRDNLKELVEESRDTLAAIESTSNGIIEANEAAKSMKKGPAQPPANDGFESNFFGFDTGVPASDKSHQGVSSVNNDGYVDVSATYYGVETPATQPVQTTELLGGSTPYTTTTQNSLAVPPINHAPPDVNEPTKVPDEEIEQMKREAQETEALAAQADDRARALAMQLEELRIDLDEANNVIMQKKAELQNKKKAFLRGSTKPLKRELEGLQQQTIEKTRTIQDGQASYTAAQSEASRLKRQAEATRQEAEAIEKALAQQSAPRQQNAALPPVPSSTPANFEQPAMGFGGFPGDNFGGYGGPPADPFGEPPEPPSAPPPVPPPSQQLPMGYGGYTATPARGEIKDKSVNEQGATTENMNAQQIGISVQSVSSEGVEIVGQSNDNMSVISQATNSVMGGVSTASATGAPDVHIEPESSSGVEVTDKNRNVAEASNETLTFGQTNENANLSSASEKVDESLNFNNTDAEFASLDAHNAELEPATGQNNINNIETSNTKTGKTNYTGIMGYGTTSHQSLASTTHTADNSAHSTHSNINSLYGQSGYTSDAQSASVPNSNPSLQVDGTGVIDSGATSTNSVTLPQPEAPPSINETVLDMHSPSSFGGIPTPTNSNLEHAYAYGNMAPTSGSGEGGMSNNNMESSLGGIPAPASSDDGPGFGTSNFGGISASRSNDTGASFGGIPTPTNNYSGNGMGGSSFDGIPDPVTEDIGTTLMGAKSGEISAPISHESMDAATFGDIPEPKSVDVGVNMGVTPSVGMATTKSNEGGNVMEGSRFEGIPDSVSNDARKSVDGSVFNGLPSSTSVDGGNGLGSAAFGGIPAPRSDDAGANSAADPFGCISVPTSTDTATGLGTTPFGGIPAPLSGDTGTSLGGTTFGGIPTPTNQFNENSKEGATNFGGIPAPLSGDAGTGMEGATNFGGIPAPLSGDAGTGLGDVVATTSGDAGTSVKGFTPYYGEMPSQSTNNFGMGDNNITIAQNQGNSIGGGMAYETTTNPSPPEINTMSEAGKDVNGMGIMANGATSSNTELDGIPTPTTSFANEYPNPFAGM